MAATATTIAIVVPYRRILLIKYPSSFGFAYFQWTPAEKDILKILNKTSVINPCFNSLKATFSNFYLLRTLATIYNAKLAINSTKSNNSIILQLLRKELATFNLL